MPRKRGVQSQFKNPGKRKKDGVGRPLTVFPLADIGCPKRGIVVIVSCIFRGPPRGQRRVLGIIFLPLGLAFRACKSYQCSKGTGWASFRGLGTFRFQTKYSSESLKGSPTMKRPSHRPAFGFRFPSLKKTLVSP